MYASVTNIIPSLDDELKISGRILFSHDPLICLPFHVPVCVLVWRVCVCNLGVAIRVHVSCQYIGITLYSLTRTRHE